jgi:hypothetical protein
MMTQRHDRLCALADSPSAAIRWRYSDYEQLLKKQLRILLAAPVRSVGPPPNGSGPPASYD